MTIEQSPAPSDVADVYDGIGQIYGSAWGPNYHYGYWDDADDTSSIEVATDRLTDMMISGLDVRPGQRVLDVGCGIGHPALRLVRTGDVDVVGISVSHVQVAQANELAAAAGLAEKAKFQFTDAMDMPFPDGSFDAAWAFESMWHMPDRGQVLSEIARVLRPGGHLAIVDVIERGPVSPEGRKVLDHVCENYAVKSLGTVDEYRTALAANGFVDVEIRDISDNCNRTLAVMADAVETKYDELAALVGEEQATSLLAFMRLSAVTPEQGYLYLAAVRA
ncbi:methyltransferase domain-containing protein [Umezawaea endophytica]|uniref:Methyltransferase domain-containing protein n=1 Tax=Umezawaea endophytica TaxID=1654476 RepID=A0A9X3AEL3_9PSEU|nr:methyltransferase domain-containing protein [Umezawaea endophytica]MCS7477001.1 methyltransferase domain-containing protein [Umezawaea endophytica]